MPQLVGVSYHIDCCDLSVLDFKRGRLKFAIGLQCDETGQSIDKTGTNQFRAMLPEKIRQRLMDLHDGIEAENRTHGRRTLAAAVRMNTDIGRQHRSKRFHVAVARRGEKSLGKLKATLFVDLEARSRLADTSRSASTAIVTTATASAWKRCASRSAS